MAPLLAFGPSLKVAPAPNMDHHRVTSYGAHGACLYRHHHIKVFEQILEPNLLAYFLGRNLFVCPHRSIITCPTFLLLT